MAELIAQVADRIDRAVQRVTPLAYRMQRKGRRWMRRAMRKPRSVSEGPNLLPLLIQVLASFSKADGVLLEEEIDSSLGFLRYDYPEAVYSELRQLFRQALYEQQDLTAMAQKLSAQLSTERKIMLGVQLYDLISQAGLKQEQVVQFYSFMSQLGMAAQAIDIVYQLNASEESDPGVYQRGSSPLESISFGNNGQSDVMLKSLGASDRLLAFRYHDLILLKNYSSQSISVRSRPLARGGFCRIYPGQRILVGDQVLSYQELAQYFNAKKNVSLPQIFIRVNRDSDEVELERAMSNYARGEDDNCLRAAEAFQAGVGVPQDDKRARDFRSTAIKRYAIRCNRRDPDACHALSMLHARGFGLKQDPQAAKALLERARTACRTRQAPICARL